jgi:hypothetical protein
MYFSILVQHTERVLLCLEDDTDGLIPETEGAKGEEDWDGDWCSVESEPIEGVSQVKQRAARDP